MKRKFKLIIALLFILIALVLAYNFYSNYVEINKLENKIEEMKQEIKTTRNKNKKLKTRVENVDDLKYIERIAREKLGLVKPGETLLIPVEKENKESKGSSDDK